MKTPTVHLNGTSANELTGQLEDAVRALNAALDAMTAAAPNARDYYVQGDRVYAEAAREHANRLSALLVVRDEMMAMLEHVVDQADQR